MRSSGTMGRCLVTYHAFLGYNVLKVHCTVLFCRIYLQVVVYAVLVVVVIGMCPIIMFSSEALASDIQKYTQTLVHKTTELNIEKHKADTLLFQVRRINASK